MSLGFAGRCRLEAEDEKTAIYSYTGENWNLPKDAASKLEQITGAFVITKKSLEEPEIHTKMKRIGRGKKRLSEKRVMHTPDIGQHLEDGDIVIEKLCGVDKRESEEAGIGLPRVVRNLLYHVYERYMEEGVLPEEEAFVQ